MHIMYMRGFLKEVKDRKVVPGGSVAKQQWMVVFKVKVETRKKRRLRHKWRLNGRN